jgi:3-hydroxybutyryl-CoA dehydrogenase
MKIEQIRRVLIIGAGTMGQQIGWQCAAHGLDVALYDIEPQALTATMTRIGQLADAFIAAGRLTREEADQALNRIRTSADARQAAHEVDIVSESVPEDPQLKARVLAQFNALCPARALFTTNTSTLLPSMLAAASGRPAQFAALHFHDVRLSRVVDVMPHPGTSAETLALIAAFARRIGQIPIVMHKESPGYVFNAMLMELFKAAQSLAAREIASVEDIDRCWMGVMHTASGPFGMMDSIGLDTVWQLTDYWARRSQDPQQLANALFMKRQLDNGCLGVKNGRGFYCYPRPAFAAPGFLEGLSPAGRQTP